LIKRSKGRGRESNLLEEKACLIMYVYKHSDSIQETVPVTTITSHFFVPGKKEIAHLAVVDVSGRTTKGCCTLLRVLRFAQDSQTRKNQNREENKGGNCVCHLFTCVVF
jgi:hypothetical protein